jgi:MoxR-like ATPase
METPELNDNNESNSFNSIPNTMVNRVDLTALKNATDKVRDEIAKIIVGQHQLIDMLIVGLLSDGHVLLEGLPGVAKTLTAKLLSKTLNIKFSRIQFTPDLMPSDVIGTSIFNLKNSEFQFKPGPIFANVVLIDEINRAPAKTQAALFECMQERQVTIDGVSHKLSPPFIVLATQNPIEQEGTYRLPEAQLDRFLFKINIGYPSLQEETNLLKKYHQALGNFDPETVTAVMTGEELAQYRKQVQQIHVEDKLLDYIAKIVHQTRNNKSLYLGASPRATLYTLTAAKAFAAINARDFITPDDIKFVAPFVLHHRVILTPEKEMEGTSPIEIVRQVIETVEVPR